MPPSATEPQESELRQAARELIDAIEFSHGSQGLIYINGFSEGWDQLIFKLRAALDPTRPDTLHRSEEE